MPLARGPRSGQNAPARGPRSGQDASAWGGVDPDVRQKAAQYDLTVTHGAQFLRDPSRPRIFRHNIADKAELWPRGVCSRRM